MKKPIFTVIVLVLLTFTLKGQNSFSVNRTTIELVKPSSFFVMYDPVEIRNLTENPLSLRWKRLSNGHGQTNPPEAWEIAVQDPSNYYNPATSIDSADFVLLTGDSSISFFILQLFPNSTDGNHTYYYQIHNPENPNEFINLTFIFSVTPVSDIQHVNQIPGISLFPNPTSFPLSIQNNTRSKLQFRLFNIKGELKAQAIVNSNSSGNLGESQLPKGLYFLYARSNTEHRQWIQKIIIP